jgi:hypothetical protein
MSDFGPNSDFVILRRFQDLPEAELAQSLLESAGIACILRDDTTIGMHWGWSNALGGIKICVPHQDANAATQILDQSIPETFEVEGVGKYEQPRCPKCRSLDISAQGMNASRAGLLAGLHLGVPIPIPSRRYWKCRSCGHEWPNSELSEPNGETLPNS